MLGKNKINQLFLIALFLFYAITTVVIMLHHEVWIDEAQAWFIVRDLSPLGVLKQIQIEGHPFLWYFIIMPFAKMGLGIIWMQAISVLVMIVSTALLLWKSPFNSFTKTAVALSPCYIYWLPDVARSYCLVALLIFLLAIYWNKQKENPYSFSIILILLANTHILMFAFCFCIFITFAFENLREFFKSKNIHSLVPVIMQGTMCLSMWIFFCVINPSNVSAVAKSHNIITNLLHFVSCFDVFSFLTFFNLYIYYFACFVSIVLFISLPILLFKNDKRIFFAVLFGLLFQFYIYIFVIYVIPQRVALTLLLVIFAFWAVANKDGLKKNLLFKITNLSFALFFALSIPISLNLVRGDYFNNFSYSKDAAEFIKKNLPDETVFVGAGWISSLKAYCPEIKFYSPSLNNYYSFYPFANNKYKPYDYKMSKEALKKHHIKYIVSYKRLIDKDLVEVYQSDVSKFFYSDKYYIYKYTAGE